MSLQVNRQRFWRGVLLVVLGLYPVVVTRLFKILPRDEAAFWAGVGFLVAGILGLIQGFRLPSTFRSFGFWGALIFLIFSAIPIWVGRLAQPDLSFEELLILGVPGPYWHRAASPLYGLFLLGLIWDQWSWKRLYFERLTGGVSPQPEVTSAETT